MSEPQNHRALKKRPSGGSPAPAPPPAVDGEHHEAKRLRPPRRAGEDERLRLKRLCGTGSLVNPLGSHFSFADLAHALSLCSGLMPEIPGPRRAPAQVLAHELGGTSRRHIVVVLCDGMGNSVLEKHLAEESFLRSHNDASRLVAIFPSTTPAALTTLATGVWPGQHGLPGWDLREQRGCEYPGKAVPTVQLRILHDRVTDMRVSRPVVETDQGFTDREIYVAAPWADTGKPIRKLLFVNAYRGTDFTRWSEGKESTSFDGYKIPETSLETLGVPEGSAAAVAHFAEGVDAVLRGVAEAEKEGQQSYVYLYTAHPDKHMHPLGVEHEEVTRVLRGLDAEVQRLWAGLDGLDAALLVTADHGHVTVRPEDMITLPQDVVDCLEYANIGVHGKGRHAVLHVRSGRHEEFELCWSRHPELRNNFLLLDVDAAADEGLFGPEPPKPRVRPRLGDFLAISLNAATLVTPDEALRFRDTPATCACQGAHGSIAADDMRIPYILCTPETR